MEHSHCYDIYNKNKSNDKNYPKFHVCKSVDNTIKYKIPSRLK